MRNLAGLALVFVALTPAGAFAQTSEWRISDESVVRFECAGAEIVEAAGGRFASVTGQLRADPANLEVSRGAVAVVMGSITTDDSSWDAMFRRAPFLAIDEHPRARFTLERVQGPRALRVGHWTRVQLVGRMIVRGRERPRTIPGRVRWMQPSDGPERLEVRADFAVPWTDHRINVPTGWTRRFAGDHADVHLELVFTRRAD